MAELFLSYAREDYAKASALAGALNEAGHQVWWDRDIKAGHEYSLEIETALQRADYVVVLWSHSSVTSAWVRDEAEEGRDSGRLVPVTIEQVRPPIGFRQLHTVDLSDALESGIASKVADLLPSLEVGDREEGQPTKTAEVERASVDRNGETNAEARRALSRGKYLREKESIEALRAATEEFRNAIKLAPQMAEAYALLADTLGVRGRYLFEDWRETYLDARDAAHKALELGPDLPIALSSAGFIAFTYEWDWNRAERLLRNALERDPQLTIATVHLARLLEVLGRFEEAIAIAVAALDTAPASVVASNSLGLALSRARHFDEAIQQFEATLVLEPANYPALYHKAWNLAYSGRASEAVELARRVFDLAEHNFQAVGLLGYTYALTGKTTEARQCVDELLTRGRDTGQYNSMMILTALGDTEQALDMLESEYRQRSFALLLLSFDPAFDPLRSCPRFQRLIGKLRLPATSCS